MKLKSLTNAVTSKAGRQILLTKKHSPTLLFAAGAIGFVATVVLASRATLKLDQVIEDAKEDLERLDEAPITEKYTEDDNLQDKLFVYAKTTVKVAKMYAIPTVVGVASMAALTGSHHILKNRLASASAAYMVLDQGFRAYRQRVVEQLGPDRDREFRYGLEEREVVEETKTGPQVKKLKDQLPVGVPSIYARCFDKSSTPNWSPAPGANQHFLQCQQSWANDMLRMKGHVLLNDVYDMLGLPRSSEGCIVGWVKDNPKGDGYISFGIFGRNMTDGMDFVTGHTKEIWLDFNVDGIVYDLI